MIYLRRYNESVTIKATDDTIKEIVHSEINKLGNDADLNHIDVSGVTIMSYLFYDHDFNGDISSWNVSNVMDMSGMFNSSLFNGDISKWDVRNVRDMSYMFHDSSFDGDISQWDVRNVVDMECIFIFSKLREREPWWYVLSPLFKGDNYSMFDSLDFKWIDIESKIIYKDKLIRTLKRSYNKGFNGKLPPVFGFTYK